MKIYEVSYIGADDATYNEYFTSKKEAEKVYNALKRIEQQEAEAVHEEGYSISDDDRDVKTVFDIHTMDCEISKTGILNLLKQRFSSTQ